MKIMFFDEQNSRMFSKDIRAAIQNAVEVLGKFEGVHGSINLLLTDDAGIKELNSEFRDKDAPTDVLSFPAYNFEGLIKDNFDNIEWEYENGSKFLGDLAISLERAYTQAEEYGHSPVRETAFLALHGVLHILGYDHNVKEDEEVMKNIQNKILNEAGINRD